MKENFGVTCKTDAKEKVKDIQFFGTGDPWKLLSKAWSEEEEWMKSTKAMEIAGIGCLVQVSTQMEEQVAEAVTFVKGVKIHENVAKDGEVLGRELVPINS